MIELDLQLAQGPFSLSLALSTDARAVAILGPSGSGKTTLLETIAGLRPRVRGRIAVDGVTLLDTRARVRLAPERRRIGYVPQDSLLFPHLDVRANIRFGLRHSDGEDVATVERRYRDAVALVELESLVDRRTTALSGGERQRVALARALATAPRLLVLDEPLASLDVELRARIFPYLLRVRDEARVRLLYVTHSVGEAMALADEAVLLRGGKIEAHGPPREIIDTRRFAALDPRGSFDNLLHGTITEIGGERTGRLTLAGSASVTLVVVVSPGMAVGASATYVVPAEDILLANHPLTGVSARNVLAGRVTGIDPVDGDAMVRVEASGVEWRARLTATAVEELDLADDKPVWLAIKTHALRRIH